MLPQTTPAGDQAKLRQAAEGQSFGDLKRRLEALLAEKVEINESLAAVARGERAALKQADGQDEDLDRLVREDEAAVRQEQRAAAIGRLKAVVADIDE